MTVGFVSIEELSMLFFLKCWSFLEPLNLYFYIFISFLSMMLKMFTFHLHDMYYISGPPSMA